MIPFSVQRYSARKGVVYLVHPQYSSSASASSITHAEIPIIAVVDVTHALGGETFQDRDLEVGSWVNVLGSICWRQDGKHVRHRGRQGKPGLKKQGWVNIQAIIIWSAGSLRLDTYEQAVRMRMQSEEETA